MQAGHMNLQGRQACLRGRHRTADLCDFYCSLQSFYCSLQSLFRISCDGPSMHQCGNS